MRPGAIRDPPRRHIHQRDNGECQAELAIHQLVLFPYFTDLEPTSNSCTILLRLTYTLKLSSSCPSHQFTKFSAQLQLAKALTKTTSSTSVGRVRVPTRVRIGLRLIYSDSGVSLDSSPSPGMTRVSSPSIDTTLRPVLRYLRLSFHKSTAMIQSIIMGDILLA